MKIIPNFPKYCIDSDGTVYSFTIRKKGNSMKPFVWSGYHYVKLIDGAGDQYSVSVHRLVATEYLPNPRNLPFTNHKNGIKTDNRLENLEWVTHSENMLHKTQQLLIGVGEGAYQHILTEQNVLDIRTLYNPPVVSGRMLADLYGVTRSAISAIIRRKNWKHI